MKEKKFVRYHMCKSQLGVRHHRWNIIDSTSWICGTKRVNLLNASKILDASNFPAGMPRGSTNVVCEFFGLSRVRTIPALTSSLRGTKSSTFQEVSSRAYQTDCLALNRQLLPQECPAGYQVSCASFLCFLPCGPFLGQHIDFATHVNFCRRSALRGMK